jgi:hypothetical protein
MRSVHTTSWPPMASWFRIGSADPKDSVQTGVNALGQWRPDGAYVTDRTNLYRYPVAIPSDSGELVAPENCVTLKAVLFSLDDVRALRVRSVVPVERYSRAGTAPADRTQSVVQPLR